jgi:DNA-binding PadR family transcriptional regulator
MSVPHAILAILSKGPSFGLRLQQEFEAGTAEMWPLNAGQVYTTLQRLERDDMVDSDSETGERSRREYVITESGRRELDHWLRTPADTDTPPRNELVIKVLVALQVPGTDVHAVIQTHRRAAIEMMQRYTRLKADASRDDLALSLVVDAELFRIEGIARWLDTAEARLTRTAALPAESSTTAEHQPATVTAQQ